ncbi:cation:dicarboxylase symporter family transporter [Phyllobacterium sp. LjRoot231]
MFPDFATKLQPLADGFIKLIKMLLAPVIFATVVLGIAKMGDIKEGRCRPRHRRCRHRRTTRGHSPPEHRCRSRSPALI